MTVQKDNTANGQQALRMRFGAVSFSLFTVAYLVLQLNKRHVPVSGGNVSCRHSICDTPRSLVLRKALSTLVLLSIFLFTLSQPTLYSMLDSGKSQSLIVLALPIVMAKALVFTLRFSSVADSRSNGFVCMVAFAVNTTTSIMMRRRFITLAGRDLGIVFAGCIAMSVIELITRTTVGFAYVMRAGNFMHSTGIHRLTLSGLIDVAANLQVCRACQNAEGGVRGAGQGG